MESRGRSQVEKPGSCDLKSLVKDLKKDAERAAIVQALEQTGGNRQDAAALLRISLRGLHYKIRSYGIESASSRPQSPSGQREAGGPHPAALEATGVCAFPRNAGGKLIPMERAGERGGWPPADKFC